MIANRYSNDNAFIRSVINNWIEHSQAKSPQMVMTRDQPIPDYN